jgi:hypothetical protein
LLFQLTDDTRGSVEDFAFAKDVGCLHLLKLVAEELMLLRVLC